MENFSINFETPEPLQEDKHKTTKYEKFARDVIRFGKIMEEKNLPDKLFANYYELCKIDIKINKLSIRLSNFLYTCAKLIDSSDEEPNNDCFYKQEEGKLYLKNIYTDKYMDIKINTLPDYNNIDFNSPNKYGYSTNVKYYRSFIKIDADEFITYKEKEGLKTEFIQLCNLELSLRDKKYMIDKNQEEKLYKCFMNLYYSQHLDRIHYNIPYSLQRFSVLNIMKLEIDFNIINTYNISFLRNYDLNEEDQLRIIELFNGMNKKMSIKKKKKYNFELMKKIEEICGEYKKNNEV